MTPSMFGIPPEALNPAVLNVLGAVGVAAFAVGYAFATYVHRNAVNRLITAFQAAGRA